MELKTNDYVYKNCNLYVGNYMANNGLAIQIYNEEDELDDIFTVCLPNEPVKENEAYIDVNNCPYILKFLEEYNLAEPTGFMGYSGWCFYPLYRFNMDEVNKYIRKE